MLHFAATYPPTVIGPRILPRNEMTALGSFGNAALLAPPRTFPRAT
jgi:hypothetical protein